MKPIVALPFRSQATLVCQEAKQRLIDAGFTLVCNETGKALPRQEQKEMIRDAFAVIAGTETYDADMLAEAKNLRVIVRFGVGTDNFDLEAMARQQIAVGVIANHVCVAEFALTLLLALLKNLPRYDQAVRDGRWARYPMHELSQKTVGIIGFGRIGRSLAAMLAGFRTKLLVYDPYLPEEQIRALGATPMSLDALLENSDIVSLHLPSTPQTHHLINKETIAKMKDGAYFVNTSRGVLVDEAALYEALTQGKLAGAALDVYEKEPVTRDNPLFALDNVVLAPHVSALSQETNYNACMTCVDSILQVAKGGTPVYPVR